MKRIISCLIATMLILRIPFLFNGIDAETFTVKNGENNEAICVARKLEQNTELMKEVMGDEGKRSCDYDSSIEVSISDNLNIISGVLFYKDKVLKYNLEGNCKEVATERCIGYVATYEGAIDFATEEYELDNDKMLPIIIDVVFSKEDMFLVVTIGCASESKRPDIAYYGDFTEDIGNISQKNAESVLKEKKVDTGHKYTSTRVNGICKYQGSSTINVGSYTAGSISVFHADELRNQGNMSTYVKINTNCYNIEDYLNNDMGYGGKVHIAYADKFSISICGNNGIIHAVGNTYVPQNSETNTTLQIPVYLGSVLGVQLIPYQITTSSTIVTVSRYPSNSQHPNNRVTWQIYKMNGWNPWEFEGDYTSQNGMTGASNYTVEGNITGSNVYCMYSTGSIRYEYWVMINGKSMSYHISTGTLSKTTYVMIKP